MINLEDLKCCGNCSFRKSLDMGDNFSETCTGNLSIKQSYGYCSEWQYDELLQKDRLFL